MHEFIVSLIMQFSAMYGLDPLLVLSVVQHESNFKVNAVGDAGELGLFQIMPSNFKKLSKREILKPEVNIALGIYLLAYAKKRCVHQVDNTWLVCFNLGEYKAKRVRHPKLWKYYKHVESIRKQAMLKLKKDQKVKIKDLYGKNIDGEGLYIKPSSDQKQFKDQHLILIPEMIAINISSDRIEVIE